jgi:hypothetical protein
MNNIHIHNESNKVLDVDYPYIYIGYYFIILLNGWYVQFFLGFVKHI